MGFGDFLAKVIASSIDASKSAACKEASKRAAQARKYEREHPNMSNETRQKLNEYNRQTEKLATYGGTTVNLSESYTPTTYLGKTPAEWDHYWRSIGKLATADLSPYNNCVGLYRHIVNGKVKYIGRAIELYNGGFRKRLSDYRRDSDSARQHSSGKTIHEHLDEIVTEILIIGNTDEAVEATKILEQYFIGKYRPEWNKQFM